MDTAQYLLYSTLIVQPSDAPHKRRSDPCITVRLNHLGKSECCKGN